MHTIKRGVWHRKLFESNFVGTSVPTQVDICTYVGAVSKALVAQVLRGMKTAASWFLLAVGNLFSAVLSGKGFVDLNPGYYSDSESSFFIYNCVFPAWAKWSVRVLWALVALGVVLYYGYTGGLFRGLDVLGVFALVMFAALASLVGLLVIVLTVASAVNRGLRENFGSTMKVIFEFLKAKKDRYCTVLELEG